MNSLLKKIIQISFSILFLLGFLFVSTKLFFPQILQHNQKQEESTQQELLTIIHPFQSQLLSPYSLDSNQRQILANIYEPLVNTDANFNYQPALAISWGTIQDNIWEFHLRPDVFFHNQKPLTSTTVKTSIFPLIQNAHPDFQSLVKNIEDIVIIDELTLQFILKEPDSLFLNKISKLYIHHNNHGTGPYLEDPENGGFYLSNNTYWQRTPLYKQVQIIEETNKQDRLELLLNNEAQFLSQAPFDSAKLLQDRGLTLQSTPSLEVQFLAFNNNSELFQDIENKLAFIQLINPAQFTELLGEYALTVNQFVSSGIFGFHQQLPKHLKTQNQPLQGKTIQIHLPQNLTLLGEFLRTSLQEQNINPIISYLNPEDFLISLQEQKGDIYFLAFKSELADSQQFFTELALENSQYNFFNYQDQKLQQLYQLAQSNLNSKERLSQLREMMSIVTHTNPYGLPLFQYQTLFAHSPQYQFTPRLDGLVLFDNIRKK